MIDILFTLLAQTVTSGIQKFKSVFDDRFRANFPLPEEINTPEYFKFAKAMTSNLLGGIGYFYGDSIVDYSFVQEWDDEEAIANDGRGGNAGDPTVVEPRGLLTATPSRSFFPRGFYWCVNLGVRSRSSLFSYSSSHQGRRLPSPNRWYLG